MEQSRCCDAPVVVEVRPDLPNFSDDEYELRVPFRVCSKCGAIIIEERYQGGRDTDAGPKDTVL